MHEEWIELGFEFIQKGYFAGWQSASKFQTDGAMKLQRHCMTSDGSQKLLSCTGSGRLQAASAVRLTVV